MPRRSECCNYLLLTPKDICICKKKAYAGPKTDKKKKKGFSSGESSDEQEDDTTEQIEESEEKKYSSIKKVGHKKTERLQNGGSEIQAFIRRFTQLKERGKNYCMITGTLIEPTEDNDLTPASFPHILPKGKYPELRLLLNNIGLVRGIEEHALFDKAVNKLKDDIGLHELVRRINSGEEIDISPYVDLE